MAKITVEQVKKLNDKCGQGFCLDLNYFLMHGEKELHKNVKITEDTFFEYSLSYRRAYKGYRATGYDIIVRRTLYKQDGSMAVNTTGWDTIVIKEGLDKKLSSKLIEITSQSGDLTKLFDNAERLEKRVIDTNGMIAV